MFINLHIQDNKKGQEPFLYKYQVQTTGDGKRKYFWIQDLTSGTKVYRGNVVELAQEQSED